MDKLAILMADKVVEVNPDKEVITVYDLKHRPIWHGKPKGKHEASVAGRWILDHLDEVGEVVDKWEEVERLIREGGIPFLRWDPYPLAPTVGEYSVRLVDSVQLPHLAWQVELIHGRTRDSRDRAL